MLRLTTYFVRSAVLHQHPSSIVGLDHSLIKLSAAKNSFILTKNRFVHRRATNFAEPGCLHRCSSKQYDLKNNCTKFDVQTKSFHTSSRNEIHPLLWALAKPVAKLASVISGRLAPPDINNMKLFQHYFIVLLYHLNFMIDMPFKHPRLFKI